VLRKFNKEKGKKKNPVMAGIFAFFHVLISDPIGDRNQSSLPPSPRPHRE